MREGNPIFDSGLNKEDLDPHIVFSPSQLNTWDECKKKGYYVYRKNFRPETTERYLRLGTIIHWMLQRMYEGWPVTKILDEADNEFPTFEDNALVFKASGLMYRYQEHWRYGKDDFTILGVEQYMLVPYTTPAGRQVYLNGYVDLIYEKAGRLGVIDHKSGAKFWTLDQVFFDRQLMIYAFMLYLLGFQPHEVAINNVKTSVLGEGVEKKLSSELFNRVTVPLDIRFLLGYMNEVGNTIDNILSLEKYDMSLSKENCAGCIFRHACTMYLEGTNPDTYLQQNFGEKRKEVKVNIKGLPG